jgi:hypothetical protein
MRDYAEGSGQASVSEDVRVLLRAYVALSLARRAAELYTEAAAAHPLLAAIVNNQELAARELDAVLENALSGSEGCAAPPEAGEECASLIM